jgi:hypothetical protein
MHTSTARSRLILLAAAPLLSLSSGCATYVNYLCHDMGPADAFVLVESEPPGALAKFSDGRSATTPAQVCVRSDEEITVDFTKDGFEPASAVISPIVNPWFWVNIIMLPPIGFLVDVEQGAVWTCSPGHVTVQLQPLPKAGSRFVPAAGAVGQ